MFAKQLRNNPTDAERSLWQRLRRRRFAGHKFRRQHPLGPYVLDFVCLDAHLVIEVDGAQHMDRIAYDTARDQWLVARGFRVLRFWDNTVLTQGTEVEQAIWEALGLTEGPPP